MMKSIKDWPKSERPWERFLSQGAGALSDAELLAVILRNGVRPPLGDTLTPFNLPRLRRRSSYHVNLRLDINMIIGKTPAP